MGCAGIGFHDYTHRHPPLISPPARDEISTVHRPFSAVFYHPLKFERTLKDDQKQADHQHDENSGQIPATILLFAGCAFQAVLDRRIETKPRLQSRNISIAEP
ncbi:hypothetical protein, partial [Agrobacterium fabrum]|uniref:hypothetical protein n=1 Tax=Agrobacterium fabrum TaxID=1176649 RepID=UPI001AED9795